MTCSATNLPERLKSLGPYIKQARDLEKVNPQVAHWCKIFALQKGIPLMAQDDPAGSEWLTNLMDEVEQDKKALDLPKDEVVNQQNVIDSAMTFFDRADDQERANIANRTVHLQFFAAIVLFEVAVSFGPLDSDTLAKQNYAKVKMAAIGRALKSGAPYAREPDVGADGRAIADSTAMHTDMISPPPFPPAPAPAAVSAPAPYYSPPAAPYAAPQVQPPAPAPGSPSLGGFASYGLPAAPAPTPAPAAPLAPAHYFPSQHAPAPPAPPPLSSYGPSPERYASSGRSTAPNGYKPSPQQICEAARFTKFSLNALNFADVISAHENLLKALASLEGRMPPSH